MKTKFNRNSSLKFILAAIATIYSTLVWLGLYGYGIDYHEVYSQPNFSWGGVFNLIGFRLASLSIQNIHFGVLIVSLLTSLSLFKILELHNTFFLPQNNQSFILAILTYILLLHTWPIIMSNVNVMRQGIAMAFFYFALISITEHKRTSIILLAVLLFSHKSGLLLLFYISIAYSLTFITRRIKQIKKKALLFTPLFIISIIIAFKTIITFTLSGNTDTRTIGADFTREFLIINFSYIAFYFFLAKGNFKKEIITNTILISSVLSPFIYFLGYNWQYERLQMIMLIMLIFNLSRLMQKKYQALFIFISALLLFTATIYSGMFTSLYH